MLGNYFLGLKSQWNDVLRHRNKFYIVIAEYNFICYNNFYGKMQVIVFVFVYSTEVSFALKSLGWR